MNVLKNLTLEQVVDTRDDEATQVVAFDWLLRMTLNTPTLFMYLFVPFHVRYEYNIHFTVLISSSCK